MKNKVYLVGIDIGTSGTKTAIYDNNGMLAAEYFEESKLYYPEKGAVEQDMNEIYSSVINTLRKCLDISGISAGKIEGISIDGQMAGICSIDKNWEAVTPYDSWLDIRCGEFISAFKEIECMIIKKSGGPPTFSHGPKMLWWKNKNPQIFNKIAKFLTPGAYVAGMMAGLKPEQAFIDNTYIHFSNFADIKYSKWSEEILDYFNFPESKLPVIVKPYEIIGKVSHEAAKYTGLLEGTPIAAGCGDQTANILGSGINKPGMIFDVAGTASVFSVSTERYAPDVKNKTLFTARTVFNDLWYAIAYINGGGLNLRWFRDEFMKGKDCALGNKECCGYKALDTIASEIKPGSENLFFIPHMGGSVCPNNSDIKGVFFGLTWRHKKEHLYRSMLEAVAYEYKIYMRIEKELVKELKINQARVIGGGSKSRLWNQIKSDILEIPYVKLRREEFGTLGSAILAGYATGVIKDMRKSAENFNDILYITEPNKQNKELYKKNSDFYCLLLKNSRELFLVLK